MKKLCEIVVYLLDDGRYKIESKSEDVEFILVAPPSAVEDLMGLFTGLLRPIRVVSVQPDREKE